MYCIYCGAVIEAGKEACTACGKPVKKSATAKNKIEQETVQNSLKGTRNGGEKADQEPAAKKVLSKAASLVGALIFILLMIYSLNPDNNILGIKDMRKAYDYAQDVVLDWIDTPNSAKFPKFDASFISRGDSFFYDGDEYNAYYVDAYVDCQNYFGVEVRCDYIVIIGLPKESDNPYYYHEILSFE